MGDNPHQKRGSGPRLSKRHQVTIPDEVLSEAHFEEGDLLRIEADGDGRIVVLRAEHPAEKYFGTFPGLSAATNLEELRDEWEQ